MVADIDRARDALHSIPPDLPRDEWVRVGMAAQAAGLDFDAFNDWSAGAGNYDARAVADTWRSFKPGKGVGPGTLYREAAGHGWRMGEGKPQQRPQQAPRKAAQPPRKPAPGMSPAEVWARCEPASWEHGYAPAWLRDAIEYTRTNQTTTDAAEQASHVASRRARDAAVKALAKPAEVGILVD